MDFFSLKPVDTCQVQGLQAILTAIFGAAKETGTFVEVGANDGYSYSNTYHLAAAGWKGVYVEPVEHFYKLCQARHKDHPNITCVRAFVTNLADKKVQMAEWAGTYSGDKTFISHWPVQMARDAGIASTIRLDTLLNKEKFEPFIDLLVIDVEGHEMHVLESFQINWWRPTMIIIEAHAHHENIDYRINAPTICDYMTVNGYRCIYSDNINDIFVAKEKLA